MKKAHVARQISPLARALALASEDYRNLLKDQERQLTKELTDLLDRTLYEFALAANARRTPEVFADNKFLPEQVGDVLEALNSSPDPFERVAALHGILRIVAAVLKIGVDVGAAGIKAEEKKRQIESMARAREERLSPLERIKEDILRRASQIRKDHPTYSVLHISKKIHEKLKTPSLEAIRGYLRRANFKAGRGGR